MHWLRLVVVACVLASPASAQVSVEAIRDDASRLESRYMGGYANTLTGRDVFASLHDSIHHPAYNDLVSARAKFVAAKTKLEATVKAGDVRAASKEFDELEKLAKEVGSRLEVYRVSSSSAVEKIQIGLGVAMFAIAGLVFWLVKRRKKK